MGGRPRREPPGALVIVVDTSVWIDVLNERESPQARRCVELIEGGEPIALTDVVFTETVEDVGVWLATRALLNVIDRSFACPAWKLR